MGVLAPPNPNPIPNPIPNPSPSPSPSPSPNAIILTLRRTLTLTLTLTKVVVAAHPAASRECRRRLSGRKAAPAITCHPTPHWGDSAPSAVNGLNGTATRTRDADVTISCEIAPVQKPL
jgi:hypothetical protein